MQEVAQMKPNCKFVGIDLYYDESPETPNQAEFEVDDCELPFAEWEESVALVSIRDSFLWVRDLKTLLPRVHGMLRPNGCFQCQEVRLAEWNCNKPEICHWKDEVPTAASVLGIQLHSASDVQRALVENGLTEYGEERSRMLLCVMKRWPSQMIVKSDVSSLSASFVSLTLGLDGVAGVGSALKVWDTLT